ncbi:MAG: hemin uptake protein HemP [Pseudomonadales bacterium]|nr:hemin uptake protein HemP [Pseudomonadales bacterium]
MKKESLETAQERKVYSTEELFQGKKAIQIMHQGKRYQMQITRNEKLILTK